MATTTTTAPSLYDTLRDLKVDNIESIKGEIVAPDMEQDKKAQKAIDRIKDKYEHEIHAVGGAEIFRLKDEGKVAVIFECACGTLSMVRTSDLWQRKTCTSCIGAARKARKDEKAAKAKAKRDAQKAKADAIKDKANASKGTVTIAVVAIPSAPELQRMKKADLMELATKHGLKPESSWTKAVAIKSLMLKAS